MKNTKIFWTKTSENVTRITGYLNVWVQVESDSNRTRKMEGREISSERNIVGKQTQRETETENENEESYKENSVTTTQKREKVKEKTVCKINSNTQME